jgi:hypothetical protein
MPPTSGSKNKGSKQAARSSFASCMFSCTSRAPIFNYTNGLILIDVLLTYLIDQGSDPFPPPEGILQGDEYDGCSETMTHRG